MRWLVLRFNWAQVHTHPHGHLLVVASHCTTYTRRLSVNFNSLATITRSCTWLGWRETHVSAIHVFDNMRIASGGVQVSGHDHHLQ